MMMTKLKLALLCRNTEKGFAIPVALGFGLAIILIGITMSLRSQQSQMKVTAQTATAKSLSAAEIGLTRFQNLIDNNRALAVYCSQPSSAVTHPTSTVVACDTGTTWSNITATTLRQTQACQPDSFFTTTIQQISNAGTWQTINTSDRNQWQYRLISYTYVPDNLATPNEASGKGILVVEGRVFAEASNIAASQLQVTIPIEKKLSNIAYPGMWLKVGDTGSNNTIEANVLLNDCTANISQVQVASGYQVKYTAMDFPQLPTLPTTNITNLGTIKQNTGTLTFPRSSDPYITQQVQRNGTTETVRIFQYQVNSIDLNGTATIEITQLQPGDRVKFYLLGDIDKTPVKHSCVGKTNCHATDFQIFAYGTAPGARKTICIAGNDPIEGFILGPDYTAGVAGSGGGQGTFVGSVWVKQWFTSGGCGSNTSNTVIVQNADWDTLGLTPAKVPPQLKPVSSWEQRATK